MNRRVIFPQKGLPWLLLAPQLAITLVFFFWPAGEAVRFAFLRQDAFGIRTTFVGFENFADLLADPLYRDAVVNTLVFSFAVTALSLGIALALAGVADRTVRGAAAYRAALVWPYAIAPALAGVLWIFLVHPQIGLFGRALNAAGIAWDYKIDALTKGGPGKATETLIWRAYTDARVNLDLGGSSAQSVILMLIVIALTFVQFRFVERRVHY